MFGRHRWRERSCSSPPSRRLSAGRPRGHRTTCASAGGRLLPVSAAFLRPAMPRGAASRRCLPSLPPLRTPAPRWPRFARCPVPPERAAIRRPYSMSRISSGVGLRRVRTPSGASRSLKQQRRIHQFDSFICQHLRHSADQAFGVLRLHRRSSFTSRQSGTMEEKILACFTWPHIMNWVIFSSWQISISLLSWPERDPVQRAARARFQATLLP